MHTVNIVPEANSLLEELRGFTKSKHYLGLARCHNSTWAEEAISCVQDRIQHRLVEQGVSHPLRDDDVDLVEAFR